MKKTSASFSAILITMALCLGSPAQATKLNAQSDERSQTASVNTETDNKQVLVDVFRDLVHQQLHRANGRLLRNGYGRPDSEYWRRLRLKTERDENNLGIDQQKFAVKGMNESLVAAPNFDAAGGPGTPTIESFLTKARQEPVTFHFYWKAPATQGQCHASFSMRLLNLEGRDRRDLEVQLLSLGFPENVPVDPRLAATKGSIPLEGRISNRVKVLPDGRLVPYESPH